jgi:hypothetical protein
MQIEYVLQYLFNRKWKDLWTSKSKSEAVIERNNRISMYPYCYRVIERKYTETVVK